MIIIVIQLMNAGVRKDGNWFNGYGVCFVFTCCIVFTLKTIYMYNDNNNNAHISRG